MHFGRREARERCGRVRRTHQCQTAEQTNECPGKSRPDGNPGTDRPDREAYCECRPPAQRIHGVPERERGTRDAHLVNRTRHTGPFSAAAEIGADDRGDGGRRQKPGRAQRLRGEERPGDLFRDVHNAQV